MRSTIFLQRTRKDHHQSDKQWNCFRGNAGRTSERRGEARNYYRGFSAERSHTVLNWTEIKWISRRKGCICLLMSADVSTDANMAREELESAFDGLILEGYWEREGGRVWSGDATRDNYLPNSLISLPPFVPSPRPVLRRPGNSKASVGGFWSFVDKLLRHMSTDLTNAFREFMT